MKGAKAMKHTGVKATQNEIEEIQKLVTRASQRSAILLFGKHDLSGDAWERAKKRCHEIALAHGLPEITGFYGLTKDGEFVEA